MTAPAIPADMALERPARIHRPPLRERVGRAILPAYTALVVGYLFLPILVMIAFSFNDPGGRQNITWQGFTFENYVHIWGRRDVTGPMVNSLVVAVVSTLIATTIGTLIGLALTRYDFRGRGPLNLLIFLPMATPEVVMGSSLLALFLNVGVARGTTTIVIGHILFNVSYVVVTVKARLQGQDARLEEAAADLYADEWTTFRKVTLPLAMPGIISGALLAFALSFDDFIITNFVSGGAMTFPMFVWGAAQRGVPPQVNAMATLLFVIAVAGMLLGLVVQRKR